MAIRVIVPNKGYDGRVAGVMFNKGVGIFEDEKAGKRVAQTFGYKVEAIKEEKNPAPKDDKKKDNKKK